MLNIGVLCAMDSEISKLLKMLDSDRVVRYSGYEFHVARKGDNTVIMLKCGVGKVNAARGTQILIDKFGADMILNSGIAGGIGSGLAVGDVIIGTEFVQHDFDITAFGHVKGHLSVDEPGVTVFRADAEISDAIREAAEKVAANEPVQSGGNRRNVLEGRIASGDQFIADDEVKLAIASEFGAISAEMESAAIAQTCSYGGVPFGVIRVISDLADGQARVTGDRFEEETADLSAGILLELINSL